MRRAQRRKYHYIYKTTCKITGKYYYGMHSTDNLNDGYIGSGKHLWHSVNKYGEKNHICEKLKFFETREKLVNEETLIVNENLLKDPSCMNISLGGNDWINKQKLNLYGKNGENGKKNFLNGRELKSFLIKEGRWEQYKENISKSLKEKFKRDGHYWVGKTHTEETKEKMRLVDRTGTKNSQYGTCWITNGKENKKIKKEDKVPNGWKLGRKIRGSI